MAGKVLFSDVFSEKDPYLNAAEHYFFYVIKFIIC